MYGKIAVPPIYDNLYQIKVSYNSSKMIYFGEKEGKWALMDTFWRKELTPFRYLADKVVSYSGISQSENVGLSEKKEVRILLQRTDDIFVMLNPINLMEYPLGKGITNYALSEK